MIYASTYWDIPSIHVFVGSILNYIMGRLLAEVKAILQMVDLFPGKVEKCLL